MSCNRPDSSHAHHAQTSSAESTRTSETTSPTDKKRCSGNTPKVAADTTVKGSRWKKMCSHIRSIVSSSGTGNPKKNETDSDRPVTILTPRNDGHPYWQMAAKRNTEMSILYRLPTEVLIIIFHRLSVDDMQVLRGTSALFMQLLSDKCFAKYHLPGGVIKSSKFHTELPWQYALNGYRVHVADRMSRNDLCGRCLELRTWKRPKRGQPSDYKKMKRALAQPLRCSGCCQDHAAIFFSAKQKDTRKARRLCIGRKGGIRLCQHRVVKWAEVTGDGRLRRRSKFQITCKDPSHSRACKDNTKSRFQDTIVSCYPTLKVSRRGSSQYKNQVRVKFTRRGKMHLFDLDPRRPLRFQELRNLLRARASNTGSKGDFALCPHVSLDDGILFQAFWPSRCACFGVHRLPRQDFDNAQDEPPSTSRRGRGELPISQCLKRGTDNPAYVGQFLVPGALHVANCSSCPTSYSWSREGPSVFLEVRASSRGYFEAPLEWSWMSLVDPDSWGCKKDAATMGVLWCEEEKGKRCTTVSKRRNHSRLFPSVGSKWEEVQLLSRASS
ncbi:hypothetical protein QBC44DRAFT_370124 [Cladorrhinum sp. PSN332]|nr:hypothetical protein QBC44DRAFT_370124 [Cladorrhinum sp. PSN332]